jgi:4-phospho-D-threonate 3-dehydrogenase / 4-phospho-D-erythronate 3-dehydrogenase
VLFGITLGDSSGVGPEILIRSYLAGELNRPFIVYGDYSVVELCNSQLELGAALRSTSSPSQYAPGAINILDQAKLRADDITPGRINALSGAAARHYVVEATQAALRGDIGAIVTLPMNKEATQLSDARFTGHTELIGELCGSSDVTIMLASEKLIVTHVSTHVSLREAIERARAPRILKIIELTHDAVSRLRHTPRLAVAGLNPHAGENGLFGREEIDHILPAIEQARAQGIPVDGPFPPDTVFYLAVQRQRFDAVVCMYHDQGHIPSKLLDFEGGVNVALGLPIIRTSVDHGTAFDIAWKGIASSRSLAAAFAFAVKLAEGRK